MDDQEVVDIQEIYGDESFRDNLATVDARGKRIWLYPKKIAGKYFDQRKIVSYILLAILFITPFIHVNGHPLFLFNVLERKFILFGQIFWPQDFYLFGLGMLTFFIGVMLFTVVFGRLWCGWICPQTIFMEMVFRRIDFWLEGDSHMQKKLDQMPWNAEKISKRLPKYAIYLLVSFFINHMALAWIIGVEQVGEWMSSSPAEHPGGFAAMMLGTFAFFGVYIRFREQMCTTFCPYGRLQGVLLGDDSVTVAYDFLRGEKRTRLKKRMPEDAGDCIDCFECVKVCPTGIDIRNGIQMECVNCTACMDACDSIMDKVGKEPGLIGYKSINSIKKGTEFALSSRQKAYSVVLGLISVFLVTLLFIRTDVETTLLRQRGTLFTENQDGTIRNLYKMQMINKTMDDMQMTVETDFPDANVIIIGNKTVLDVPASGVLDAQLLIDIPRENLLKMKTPLKVIVRDGEGNEVDKVKTTFIGPF